MSFSIASDQAERINQLMEQGEIDIYATGPIQNGDAERLAAFARDHKLQAARVVFNSPGGSLTEGIKLGRVIRALGFDTSIGQTTTSPQVRRITICASACAYAFAGGVLRFLASDGGKLGLHQFRSASGSGISEGSAQTVSGLLVAYLSEMGVDANAFALASVTDPDGIVWLTSEDAEALGFANNGVLPTTADIKLANMQPYLRLNQEKPGVEIRLLLLCKSGQMFVEAGIVTDPERSRGFVDPNWVKRSYLELDGKEELVMPGVSGAHAQDSVVWLSRPFSRTATQRLLSTSELGVWLDGFGMVREGGTIDLRGVRPAVRNYIAQCLAE